jgi:copper(I)-binding protein
MKRILMTLILAGGMLLSACGSTGDEHGYDEAPGTGVEAHDYWARAALKDGNGAAYMLLHNHSIDDDALVGVSTNVAATAELHLSQMNADGTMEMSQQELIALPSDGEVELKPGGYHIMLIGLKQDLKVGDKISVVLHFEHHEDITLDVPVMDAASMDGTH